jgi:raffinose/stachyose/melibiose transport system permease protein
MVSRHLIPALFLAPALVLLGLFAYWPFAMALRLSLHEANGFGYEEFVGIRNFTALASDPVFLGSLVTLGKFLLAMPLLALGPLLGAKVVHLIRAPRASYLYRVLLVLPAVIPAMVIFLVWKEIYGDIGLLNRLLELLGLDHLKRSWLGNSATVVPAIVFIQFPFVGGIPMLIYLAGLLSIPGDLYEQARMEGAGPLRTFWSIELPLLFPQLRVVIILTLISLVQSFENILVLTGGGPGYSSTVPAIYLFRSGFEFSRLGYASAIGVFLFAITLALSALNVRVLRSRR